LKTHPNATRGEAYTVVDDWLRKIYYPFAVWAYQWMKDEAERRSAVAAASASDSGSGDGKLDIGTIDQLAQGASAGLNQYCLTNFGKMPTYTYEHLGLANWQAVATLKLPSGLDLKAVAARTNKKAAMNVAAWDLCQQLGL
jgi:hypothetical protein